MERHLMPQAAQRSMPANTLVTSAQAATQAAEALLADATAKVRERVMQDGKPSAKLLDREQRATHGLSWLATYVEAIRQLAAYAERLGDAGQMSELEELIIRI